MQHFAIRLAVAFLTFCIGLAASALWSLFSFAPADASARMVVRERACPSSMPTGGPAFVATFDPNSTVISGGVLNGKAISKPAPVYPAEAKAERVEGTVVVKVTVDESGNVEEAEAMSGHRLLRAAALDSVRQWKFTQTLLSGKPTKVKGWVTVNFQLD